MFNRNWKKFIKITKNRKPTGFLIEAIEKLGPLKGLVLDLGCGVGVDAKYLAEKGFIVEAVDLNKDSVECSQKICGDLPVTVIKKNIINYKISAGKYSLIISWNTLSFLKKSNAIKILINIQKGLIKGGIFVFGFFGPEDDWNKKNSKMSFFKIEEIKKILSGLEFIKILEVKEKCPAATGEIKFWHKIQGIARKK